MANVVSDSKVKSAEFQGPRCIESSSRWASATPQNTSRTRRISRPKTLLDFAEGMEQVDDEMQEVRQPELTPRRPRHSCGQMSSNALYSKKGRKENAGVPKSKSNAKAKKGESSSTRSNSTSRRGRPSRPKIEKHEPGSTDLRSLLAFLRKIQLAVIVQ